MWRYPDGDNILESLTPSLSTMINISQVYHVSALLASTSPTFYRLYPLFTMSINELKQIGFIGRILDSSSPDYDASLARANVAAQRKAKFIVFPESTQDVQTAIKFARKSVFTAESARISPDNCLDQSWKLPSNVVVIISLLRAASRTVLLSI